jgi:hypothetical protein
MMGIWTISELIETVEESYSASHEQATRKVGCWALNKEFWAVAAGWDRLWEVMIFGFRGGNDETVTRKIGYRSDAKRWWSCRTTLDLSQVRNGEQAISLVKVRYSLPDETAKANVEGRVVASRRSCASKECVSWRARSTLFIITGLGGQGSRASIAASIRREKPPFAAL